MIPGDTVAIEPTVHAAAVRRVRLAEPADALRIPRWLAAKALYTFAPVPLLFRLATWRGTLASLTSRGRRQVHVAVEEHLRAPEDEARSVARHFFQFRWRAGFVRLWPQIRGFSAADEVEVLGVEHLDAALARGGGAILVTAHFGYPRLVKPLLRRRGYDACLCGKVPAPGERPALPDGFTRLGAFVHRTLLRLPIWWRFDERWQVAVGADVPAAVNLRPHLETLRANRPLILVADSGAGLAGTTGEIFGIAVDVSPAPFSIARTTGSPALPVFVVDTLATAAPRAIRLQIHPPLELQVTSDETADRAANVERFVAVYEQEAATYPHNWQWSWVRGGRFRPRREDR